MKESNEWGLYDMLGNMREWCLDYYRRDYGLGLENFDGINFNGPDAPDGGLSENNNARVLRGGSFKNNSLDVKSAARSWGPASSTGNINVGFRLWCPAVYPL
jgi:formylglycine-generating enzyme required for sulfatase activity